VFDAITPRIADCPAFEQDRPISKFRRCHRGSKGPSAVSDERQGKARAPSTSDSATACAARSGELSSSRRIDAPARPLARRGNRGIYGQFGSRYRRRSMGVRVLYTGQEIRNEIRRIFANSSERRVAVVAFVGKGAIAHLPKPRGLEVYCWARAGCTIVSAIEALQDDGAEVYFAERMHAKVYWAAKSGAIVGSANVSDNAFGSGNLQEAAVAMPSKKVDIERLIRIIKPRPVTPEALEALRREEAIERRSRRDAPAKTTIPTFTEWHDGTGGTRWKWDYYEGYGGEVSRRAKEAAKEMHPTYVPQDYVHCNRGTLKESDWVLRVKLTPNGLLMAPEWIYIERVVLVAKNDRRAYNAAFPYQAIQIRERRHCPAPPFVIDASFKAALRAASKAFGASNVRSQVVSKPPTKAFLALIRQQIGAP
jgi:hypothetical protein